MPGSSVFVDAADSIVAALPSAEVREPAGSGHGWQPAQPAAVLAGYLPQRPCPGRGVQPCRADRAGSDYPLELIPGIAPARKASTNNRKSSWVRRA